MATGAPGRVPGPPAHGLIEAADLVVDTAAAAPDEVAGRIASALPGLGLRQA